MIIKTFQNRHEEPLTIVVEPWRDEYEVPHLAEAGILYAPKDSRLDRSTCVVSERQIELWLDADRFEIDIVHPSVYQRLSWRICVGGWCGGIVDGVPTAVDDLLPPSGTVTAHQFAELVIRADGWPAADPYPEKHLRWLSDRFAEHLGATSVDAKKLRHNLRRPFDQA